MSLKTFRIGGIHVPENKQADWRKIIDLPLPSQVTIPLAQHLGVPAKPLVAKGDAVKAGSLIGEPAGFVSAAVHSSVSGTVVKIEDVLDASGYKRPAVVIQVEGDEWEPGMNAECDPPETPAEIIDCIRQAGIVGMGGATFPTHVKLTPPPGQKADILIINGAECEPSLTADHALMGGHPQEIVAGIRFLMQAAQVGRAVVGIENNKPDAIAALRSAAEQFSEIQIVPLKSRYPQGGEKQLIEALTGRRVASGALPVSVGAIVQNVGTAFAVYEAVAWHKPLVERIVTLGGAGIAHPCNYRVRIGTSVAHLLTHHTGGVPADMVQVIAGGPMMGKTLAQADVPVTKGTSGILGFKAADIRPKPAPRACIRCAKCVRACCMGLEPYRLMTLVEWKDWEALSQQAVMDCIECGSCVYVCPSCRSLLDHIKWGKAELRAAAKNVK